MNILKAAQTLGRLGGQVGGRSKSDAKRAAVRENGKLGGRPRTFRACPVYRSHKWSQYTGKCKCGMKRPAGR